ncbi:Deoxyribonuclease-2-alpha, partial [Trichinella nativa]
ATDKRTPGAAVCLENAGVYNAFRTAALNSYNNISECRLLKYSKCIEIMFIPIILIFISLNCCTAQDATCKDDDGNIPPNVESSNIIKSTADLVWAQSARNVNDGREHSIARTLVPFTANNGDIKVLAYSDDPPNLPPRNEKSKAKDTDAAAWFVHTVPKFLAHLGGYSWPAAETAKGHMFLCLAFNEAHLNLVAKAIRYQEPFIYANSLSPELLNQHVELSNLITGTQIRVTPFLEHAKFATKAAANIQAFGKHTKSYSDMYARVLKNKFAANIRIWAPSDARSKSICKGQYQLRKIASPMQLAGSLVSREADSAKWALVEQKNTVCLTTNDYTVGEKKIPGAAVCLENAGVYNAFSLTETIVILVLSKSCTAQVATCKDDNNAACSFRQLVPTLRYQLHGSLEHHQVVLKFFVYKPPNVVSSSITKSEGNPTWAASAQTIDQAAVHSIFRTMASFVAEHMDIKVLAYRVLLIDNRDTDAAASFVHTVPKFLAHLGGYSWPAAETAKEHMFCLINRKFLAQAIRYQEPFIYANNLSPEFLNQHVELSNLIMGAQIRVTPFLEHAKFATKAVANIQAFGKHTKSYSDMYARVLKNKFAANIRIWAPSDARSKSICKGQYHL